jgi:hypothetical protein
MDIPQTDRRIRPLETFFGAWGAILIALVPASALGVLAFGAGILLWPGQGGASGAQYLPLVIGAAATLAIPFGIAFSLLALPFLPFRRWIVSERRPWLKPGYLAVALYGPAILIWTSDGRWSADLEAPAIVYEVIALAATLIYVPIARRMGLFPRKAPVGEVFS